MPDENNVENEEGSTISAADVLKMQAEHKEEMDTIRQQSADQATQFNETLRSLSADRQNVQPIPDPETITADQLNEILDSGQGGEALLKGVNGIVQKKIDKIVREEIDPIRAEGAAVLGQLAETQAETNVEMPYYKRFKKEITEQLQVLRPDQRMNPRAIKTAYEITMGRNQKLLMDEAKEEMLRKQTEEKNNPGSMIPGQGSRTAAGSQDPNQPKTVEEDLGDAALERLAEKKWDKDGGETYAKAGGFASWADLQVFKNDRDPAKSNYYKMLKERKASNAAA